MRTLHDGSEVPDATPVRSRDGQLFALTPDELAALAAERDSFAGAAALRAWQAEVNDSDRLLGPRQFEDLVLALRVKGVLAPADLPAELNAMLALRAGIRARKPAE